jgi:hypothetical protein
LSLILREEHGRRTFENKVLMRIFGTKKYETIGGRKLYIELPYLYSSQSVITKIQSKRINWQGK